MKIDEIIDALQRGEKFEKIVEEIETYFSNKELQNDEWYIYEVSGLIKHIKNKYFPKNPNK